MKACDWNESREELLAVLNQMQKETFEHYETIRDGLSDDDEKNSKKRKYDETIKTTEMNDDDKLKKKLFAKRLAILFSRPHSNLNPFSLYLVIFDFYLNEFQLKLLEYMYIFKLLFCYYFINS